MTGYECLLFTENKTFFSCFLSREQLEDIDSKIGGKGLGNLGIIQIRTADGREIICTDILVKYNIVK